MYRRIIKSWGCSNKTIFIFPFILFVHSRFFPPPRPGGLRAKVFLRLYNKYSPSIYLCVSIYMCVFVCIITARLDGANVSPDPEPFSVGQG